MKMPNEGLIEPGPRSLTYDSYLKVPDLLSLQQPVTVPPEHDEMLFIIIHQVYELWFKQILHEMEPAATMLKENRVMPFLRTLKRVGVIQNILTAQVEILESMTPTDFNRFRDNLNPASGFQSHQFRLVEFRLGAKDPAYLKFFRSQPESLARLEQALAEATVYDHVLRMLARRGFAIPKEVLERDVSQPYTPHDGVTEALLKVYVEADQHYDLYMTLEALIDMDERFMLWRYRHVAMVERMIGTRRGTGGSSGVKYLTQTLSKRFFPEIWDVRGYLGTSEYGRK